MDNSEDIKEAISTRNLPNFEEETTSNDEFFLLNALSTGGLRSKQALLGIDEGISQHQIKLEKGLEACSQVLNPSIEPHDSQKIGNKAYLEESKCSNEFVEYYAQVILSDPLSKDYPALSLPQLPELSQKLFEQFPARHAAKPYSRDDKKKVPRSLSSLPQAWPGEDSCKQQKMHFLPAEKNGANVSIFRLDRLVFTSNFIADKFKPSLIPSSFTLKKNLFFFCYSVKTCSPNKLWKSANFKNEASVSAQELPANNQLEKHILIPSYTPSAQHPPCSIFPSFLRETSRVFYISHSCGKTAFECDFSSKEGVSESSAVCANEALQLLDFVVGTLDEGSAYHESKDKLDFPFSSISKNDEAKDRFATKLLKAEATSRENFRYSIAEQQSYRDDNDGSFEAASSKILLHSAASGGVGDFPTQEGVLTNGVFNLEMQFGEGLGGELLCKEITPVLAISQPGGLMVFQSEEREEEVIPFDEGENSNLKAVGLSFSSNQRTEEAQTELFEERGSGFCCPLEEVEVCCMLCAHSVLFEENWKEYADNGGFRERSWKKVLEKLDKEEWQKAHHLLAMEYNPIGVAQCRFKRGRNGEISVKQTAGLEAATSESPEEIRVKMVDKFGFFPSLASNLDEGLCSVVCAEVIFQFIPGMVLPQMLMKNPGFSSETRLSTRLIPKFPRKNANYLKGNGSAFSILADELTRQKASSALPISVKAQSRKINSLVNPAQSANNLEPNSAGFPANKIGGALNIKQTARSSSLFSRAKSGKNLPDSPARPAACHLPKGFSKNTNISSSKPPKSCSNPGVLQEFLNETCRPQGSIMKKNDAFAISSQSGIHLVLYAGEFLVSLPGGISSSSLKAPSSDLAFQTSSSHSRRRFYCCCKFDLKQYERSEHVEVAFSEGNSINQSSEIKSFDFFCFSKSSIWDLQSSSEVMIEEVVAKTPSLKDNIAHFEEDTRPNEALKTPIKQSFSLPDIAARIPAKSKGFSKTFLRSSCRQPLNLPIKSEKIAKKSQILAAHMAKPRIEELVVEFWEVSQLENRENDCIGTMHLRVPDIDILDSLYEDRCCQVLVDDVIDFYDIFSGETTGFCKVALLAARVRDPEDLIDCNFWGFLGKKVGNSNQRGDMRAAASLFGKNEFKQNGMSLFCAAYSEEKLEKAAKSDNEDFFGFSERFNSNENKRGRAAKEFDEELPVDCKSLQLHAETSAKPAARFAKACADALREEHSEAYCVNLVDQMNPQNVVKICSEKGCDNGDLLPISSNDRSESDLFSEPPLSASNKLKASTKDSGLGEKTSSELAGSENDFEAEQEVQKKASLGFSPALKDNIEALKKRKEPNDVDEGLCVAALPFLCKENDEKSKAVVLAAKRNLLIRCITWKKLISSEKRLLGGRKEPYISCKTLEIVLKKLGIGDTHQHDAIVSAIAGKLYCFTGKVSPNCCKKYEYEEGFKDDPAASLRHHLLISHIRKFFTEVREPLLESCDAFCSRSILNPMTLLQRFKLLEGIGAPRSCVPEHLPVETFKKLLLSINLSVESLPYQRSEKSEKIANLSSPPGAIRGKNGEIAVISLPEKSSALENHLMGYKIADMPSLLDCADARKEAHLLVPPSKEERPISLDIENDCQFVYHRLAISFASNMPAQLAAEDQQAASHSLHCGGVDYPLFCSFFRHYLTGKVKAINSGKRLLDELFNLLVGRRVSSEDLLKTLIESSSTSSGSATYTAPNSSFIEPNILSLGAGYLRNDNDGISLKSLSNCLKLLLSETLCNCEPPSILSDDESFKRLEDFLIGYRWWKQSDFCFSDKIRILNPSLSVEMSYSRGEKQPNFLQPIANEIEDSLPLPVEANTGRYPALCRDLFVLQKRLQSCDGKSISITKFIGLYNGFLEARKYHGLMFEKRALISQNSQVGRSKCDAAIQPKHGEFSTVFQSVINGKNAAPSEGGAVNCSEFMALQKPCLDDENAIGRKNSESLPEVKVLKNFKQGILKCEEAHITDENQTAAGNHNDISISLNFEKAAAPSRSRRKTLPKNFATKKSDLTTADKRSSFSSTADKKANSQKNESSSSTADKKANSQKNESSSSTADKVNSQPFIPQKTDEKLTGKNCFLQHFLMLAQNRFNLSQTSSTQDALKATTKLTASTVERFQNIQPPPLHTKTPVIMSKTMMEDCLSLVSAISGDTLTNGILVSQQQPKISLEEAVAAESASSKPRLVSAEKNSDRAVHTIRQKFFRKYFIKMKDDGFLSSAGASMLYQIYCKFNSQLSCLDFGSKDFFSCFNVDDLSLPVPKNMPNFTSKQPDIASPIANSLEKPSYLLASMNDTRSLFIGLGLHPQYVKFWLQFEVFAGGEVGKEVLDWLLMVGSCACALNYSNESQSNEAVENRETLCFSEILTRLIMSNERTEIYGEFFLRIFIEALKELKLMFESVSGRKIHLLSKFAASRFFEALFVGGCSIEAFIKVMKKKEAEDLANLLTDENSVKTVFLRSCRVLGLPINSKDASLAASFLLIVDKNEYFGADCTLKRGYSHCFSMEKSAENLALYHQEWLNPASGFRVSLGKFVGGFSRNPLQKLRLELLRNGDLKSGTECAEYDEMNGFAPNFSEEGGDQVKLEVNHDLRSSKKLKDDLYLNFSRDVNENILESTEPLEDYRRRFIFDLPEREEKENFVSIDDILLPLKSFGNAKKRSEDDEWLFTIDEIAVLQACCKALPAYAVFSALVSSSSLLAGTKNFVERSDFPQDKSYERHLLLPMSCLKIFMKQAYLLNDEIISWIASMSLTGKGEKNVGFFSFRQVFPLIAAAQQLDMTITRPNDHTLREEGDELLLSSLRHDFLLVMGLRRLQKNPFGEILKFMGLSNDSMLTEPTMLRLLSALGVSSSNARKIFLFWESTVVLSAALLVDISRNSEEVAAARSYGNFCSWLDLTWHMNVSVLLDTFSNIFQKNFFKNFEFLYFSSKRGPPPVFLSFNDYTSILEEIMLPAISAKNSPIDRIELLQASDRDLTGSVSVLLIKRMHSIYLMLLFGILVQILKCLKSANLNLVKFFKRFPFYKQSMEKYYRLRLARLSRWKNDFDLFSQSVNPNLHCSTVPSPRRPARSVPKDATLVLSSASFGAQSEAIDQHKQELPSVEYEIRYLQFLVFAKYGGAKNCIHRSLFVELMMQLSISKYFMIDSASLFFLFDCFDYEMTGYVDIELVLKAAQHAELMLGMVGTAYICSNLLALDRDDDVVGGCSLTGTGSGQLDDYEKRKGMVYFRGKEDVELASFYDETEKGEATAESDDKLGCHYRRKNERGWYKAGNTAAEDTEMNKKVHQIAEKLAENRSSIDETSAILSKFDNNEQVESNFINRRNMLSSMTDSGMNFEMSIAKKNCYEEGRKFIRKNNPEQFSGNQKKTSFSSFFSQEDVISGNGTLLLRIPERKGCEPNHPQGYSRDSYTLDNVSFQGLTSENDLKLEQATKFELKRSIFNDSEHQKSRERDLSLRSSHDSNLLKLAEEEALELKEYHYIQENSAQAPNFLFSDCSQSARFIDICYSIISDLKYFMISRRCSFKDIMEESSRSIGSNEEGIIKCQNSLLFEEKKFTPDNIRELPFSQLSSLYFSREEFCQRFCFTTSQCNKLTLPVWNSLCRLLSSGKLLKNPPYSGCRDEDERAEESNGMQYIFEEESSYNQKGRNSAFSNDKFFNSQSDVRTNYPGHLEGGASDNTLQEQANYSEKMTLTFSHPPGGHGQLLKVDVLVKQLKMDTLFWSCVSSNILLIILSELVNEKSASCSYALLHGFAESRVESPEEFQCALLKAFPGVFSSFDLECLADRYLGNSLKGSPPRVRYLSFIADINKAIRQYSYLLRPCFYSLFELDVCKKLLAYNVSGLHSHEIPIDVISKDIFPQAYGRLEDTNQMNYNSSHYLGPNFFSKYEIINSCVLLLSGILKHTSYKELLNTLNSEAGFTPPGEIALPTQEGLHDYMKKLKDLAEYRAHNSPSNAFSHESSQDVQNLPKISNHSIRRIRSLPRELYGFDGNVCASPSRTGHQSGSLSSCPRDSITGYKYLRQLAGACCDPFLTTLLDFTKASLNLQAYVIVAYVVRMRSIKRENTLFLSSSLSTEMLPSVLRLKAKTHSRDEIYFGDFDPVLRRCRSAYDDDCLTDEISLELWFECDGLQNIMLFLYDHFVNNGDITSKELFQRIDFNGDGYLILPEFFHYLESQGEDVFLHTLMASSTTFPKAMKMNFLQFQKAIKFKVDVLQMCFNDLFSGNLGKGFLAETFYATVVEAIQRRRERIINQQGVSNMAIGRGFVTCWCSLMDLKPSDYVSIDKCRELIACLMYPVSAHKILKLSLKPYTQLKKSSAIASKNSHEFQEDFGHFFPQMHSSPAKLSRNLHSISKAYEILSEEPRNFLSLDSLCEVADVKIPENHAVGTRTVYDENYKEVSELDVALSDNNVQEAYISSLSSEDRRENGCNSIFRSNFRGCGVKNLTLLFLDEEFSIRNLEIACSNSDYKKQNLVDINMADFYPAKTDYSEEIRWAEQDFSCATVNNTSLNEQLGAFNRILRHEEPNSLKEPSFAMRKNLETKRRDCRDLRCHISIRIDHLLALTDVDNEAHSGATLIILLSLIEAGSTLYSSQQDQSTTVGEAVPLFTPGIDSRHYDTAVTVDSLSLSRDFNCVFDLSLPCKDERENGAALFPPTPLHWFNQKKPTEIVFSFLLRNSGNLDQVTVPAATCNAGAENSFRDAMFLAEVNVSLSSLLTRRHGSIHTKASNFIATINFCETEILPAQEDMKEIAMGNINRYLVEFEKHLHTRTRDQVADLHQILRH